MERENEGKEIETEETEETETEEELEFLGFGEDEEEGRGEEEEPDEDEYHPSLHPKLAEWIGRWGGSDAEIGEAMGVSEETMGEWMRRYPELGEAMERGRGYWVELTEESLQKLIKGWSYEEVDEVTEERGGVERPIKRRRKMRQVGPNAAAVVWAMENRNAMKLARDIMKGMPNEVPEAWKQALPRDEDE